MLINNNGWNYMKHNLIFWLQLTSPNYNGFISVIIKFFLPHSILLHQYLVKTLRTLNALHIEDFQWHGAFVQKEWFALCCKNLQYTIKKIKFKYHEL